MERKNGNSTDHSFRALPKSEKTYGHLHPRAIRTDSPIPDPLPSSACLVLSRSPASPQPWQSPPRSGTLAGRYSNWSPDDGHPPCRNQVHDGTVRDRHPAALPHPCPRHGGCSTCGATKAFAWPCVLTRLLDQRYSAGCESIAARTGLSSMQRMKAGHSLLRSDTSATVIPIASRRADRAGCRTAPSAVGPGPASTLALAIAFHPRHRCRHTFAGPSAVMYSPIPLTTGRCTIPSVVTSGSVTSTLPSVSPTNHRCASSNHRHTSRSKRPDLSLSSLPCSRVSGPNCAARTWSVSYSPSPLTGAARHQRADLRENRSCGARRSLTEPY
ncbi:MAG: hypothetical protein AW08_00346 [Candidatus Accumulibacter adjunctus]|uniref:Uncharacterized protein n=1 Tax=Candidatus Accumulibacter adjunctus TaxID=1454001 RepID=A0A011MIV2_9PROT|nr:MAG: hypothetical protein AW08_00346 [Candidatus Accumulibacter adjunctus]